MGRSVEVAPGGAALGTRGLRVRVDPDTAHSGKVQRNPTVVSAEARAAVAAAPHRQVEAIVAGIVDGGHRVAGIRGPHDHRGPFVDHAVVDLACLFEFCVVRSNHIAPYQIAQFTCCLRGHVLPPMIVFFCA